MKYVSLENNLKMPIIGLGTANLQGNICKEIVYNALTIGYRLIDTAMEYNNEREVGEAIKSAIKSLDILRSDLFITSKVSKNMTYEECKEQVKKSLGNLGLNYIDLYLLHKPYENALEMYRALEDLYKEGLIKSIGVSGFNQENYESFIKQVKIKPMVNQIECHLLNQRKELAKVLEKNKTILEASSPLGLGHKEIINNPILINIGNKYAKSSSQVALRYLVEKNIVVIPKAANLEHLEENFKIFDFSLTKIEKDIIEDLDQKKTVFN